MKTIIAVMLLAGAGMVEVRETSAGDQPKPWAAAASAKADTVQIVAAIKAYVVEYGQLPAPLESNPRDPARPKDPPAEDSTFGAAVRNGPLFNILRNLDAPGNTKFLRNPRRHVFIAGPSVED